MYAFIWKSMESHMLLALLTNKEACWDIILFMAVTCVACWDTIVFMVVIYAYGHLSSRKYVYS